MTKFLARTCLFIIAFLFFLGIGRVFSQDTVSVKSKLQVFQIGATRHTDSSAYSLSFFKIGEDKILTITRLSDSSETRIIGDSMTSYDQSEDTLIVYYDGRELSPSKMDIKLAVCQKGNDIEIVALGTSEGIIFFYIEATKPK